MSSIVVIVAALAISYNKATIHLQCVRCHHGRSERRPIGAVRLQMRGSTDRLKYEQQREKGDFVAYNFTRPNLSYGLFFRWML